MVSPPPGLPILGLEGAPPGCRTTFPWPSLLFPAETEWELQRAQEAQEGTLLLHCSSPLYSRHCARAGESLSLQVWL